MLDSTLPASNKAKLYQKVSKNPKNHKMTPLPSPKPKIIQILKKCKKYTSMLLTKPVSKPYHAPVAHNWPICYFHFQTISDKISL